MIDCEAITVATVGNRDLRHRAPKDELPGGIEKPVRQGVNHGQRRLIKPKHEPGTTANRKAKGPHKPRRLPA
jgi:hypothetical protein